MKPRGLHVVTARWILTKKQTTSFVFRRSGARPREWTRRHHAPHVTLRDAGEHDSLGGRSLSRRRKRRRGGGRQRGGRVVRVPSLLLSISRPCTRTEGKDGADGVDGAHHGSLHHVLPGDPTRQRLPVQRDHRQPGQDSGPRLRRGTGSQGRDAYEYMRLCFVHFCNYWTIKFTKSHWSPYILNTRLSEIHHLKCWTSTVNCSWSWNRVLVVADSCCALHGADPQSAMCLGPSLFKKKKRKKNHTCFMTPFSPVSFLFQRWITCFLLTHSGSLKRPSLCAHVLCKITTG